MTMRVVRRPLLAAAVLVLLVAASVSAIGACGGGNQPDLAAFCEKRSEEQHV